MAGTPGPEEDAPAGPAEPFPIHPTAGELTRDEPRGAKAPFPPLLNPAEGPPGAVVWVQAGCGPAGEVEAGGDPLLSHSRQSDELGLPPSIHVVEEPVIVVELVWTAWLSVQKLVDVPVRVKV
jgi:hypothetical protein